MVQVLKLIKDSVSTACNHGRFMGNEIGLLGGIPVVEGFPRSLGW
jgi:hypothetical protein